MKVHVTKVGANKAAHKMHWLAHVGYLVAASAEGHLFYSSMAALVLVFTVGCAFLGSNVVE